MSKLVKKFRKGDYEDDNYYSAEEYNQKKKRKDKQRKPRYFDEFEPHQHYTRPQKYKSY